MKRILSMIWVAALVAVLGVGVAMTFTPTSSKLQMFANDSAPQNPK